MSQQCTAAVGECGAAAVSNAHRVWTLSLQPCLVRHINIYIYIYINRYIYMDNGATISFDLLWQLFIYIWRRRWHEQQQREQKIMTLLKVQCQDLAPHTTRSRSRATGGGQECDERIPHVRILEEHGSKASNCSCRNSGHWMSHKTRFIVSLIRWFIDSLAACFQIADTVGQASGLDTLYLLAVLLGQATWLPAASCQLPLAAAAGYWPSNVAGSECVRVKGKSLQQRALSLSQLILMDA